MVGIGVPMAAGVVVAAVIALLGDTELVCVTAIGVDDMFAGVNTNMAAAAITDLEFADTRRPLKDALRCS